MAGQVTSGLQFVLSAKGADGVVREIGRLQSGIGQAGRGTERAAGGWSRWKTGISDVGRGLRSVLGMVTRLGALTGIGAGIGFASLAKGLMDADDAALHLKYELGGSGAEWRNIQEAIERARSTTGMTAAELTKAVGAAADFGMNMQAAADAMDDMAAFAKLLNVNMEDVSKATGAIWKATGGTMAPRQILAMLGAGAKAANMPEEMFLTGVGRAGRMMENASPEQIQALMQVIAGAGQEFMGQEKLIFGAFKALETLSAKQRKSLGATVGATGAETMLNLAALFRRDATAMERVNLPDNVKLIAKAMAENAEVVDSVGRAARDSRTDLEGFSTALNTAKTSSATQWAGMIEDIKKQAEPLVRSALSWLLDHGNELTAAMQTLVTMMEGLGSAIKTVLDIVTPGGVGQGGIAGPVLERLRAANEEQAARVAARKAEDEAAAAQYRGAKTPEERLVALGRGGANIRGAGAAGVVEAEMYARQVAARAGVTPEQVRSATALYGAGGAGAVMAAPHVRSGATAAARFLLNLIVNADPETPHTRVDAELQDGRTTALETGG